MDAKRVEEEISTLLSKYRKEKTGRGPIDTSSKIVGHTIYVKMNLTLTSHELAMYKFIIENNGFEAYSAEYIDEGKRILNDLLSQYGFDINTDSILIYPDINKCYLYLIIILNGNLEKDIREYSN